MEIPVYSPVAWEYRESIEEQLEKNTKGKIFYFDYNDEIAEMSGKIVRLVDKDSLGVFVELDTGSEVRIDRIITLFGKIGASYAAYDAYANSCMDCMGGDEKE